MDVRVGVDFFGAESRDDRSGESGTLGVAARQRGRSMSWAALPRRERERLLALARHLAADFAARNPWRLCSNVDVQRELRRFGKDPRPLAGVSGNLFRTRDWQATPLRLRRRCVGRRSCALMVWQYIGPPTCPAAATTEEHLQFHVAWD